MRTGSRGVPIRPGVTPGMNEGKDEPERTLSAGTLPYKWVVGRTLQWEFALPMPVNSAYQSKPSRANAPKATKPRPAPPSKTSNPPEAKAPATQEAKRQDRQEYDRQRDQIPKRKEVPSLYAQEHRRKAKELGQCRSCSTPAIPGQTRCPTCAEKHLEYRRIYDAKRRAMAIQSATTAK